MERKRGKASNTKDTLSFVFDAFRCAEHPIHAHKGVFRVFMMKLKGRGCAEHQNTPTGCVRVFETRGRGKGRLRHSKYPLVGGILGVQDEAEGVRMCLR